MRVEAVNAASARFFVAEELGGQWFFCNFAEEISTIKSQKDDEQQSL